MIKKIFLAIMSTSMVFLLASCSPSSNEKKEDTKVEKSSGQEEKAFIGEGEWAKDYSKDEVDVLNDEITARIEEAANFYGIEYTKEEKIKEENNESVNEKYVYFDNLNPEPNRMESMYYGYNLYGSNMAKGSLNLKIGFKLDVDQIKNEEKFDFKETSMSAFSEAMTNNTERDYTALNNAIIDIVKNNKKDETIENNLDGLVESITIKDDFLLYKIDSKVYQFK
ncbi:hypothetical protein [Clostridium tertium]|uniref:Lipoprotein n=1 Tax=Clostridium tertium TaxID=1559 RepID=A0A6N3DDZ4_9CLOT